VVIADQLDVVDVDAVALEAIMVFLLNIGSIYIRHPNACQYDLFRTTKYEVRKWINLVEQSSVPQVRWAKPRDSDELYRTVWVDADKLMQGWSRDPLFIDGPQSPNIVGDRIPRFDDWMKTDGLTTPVIMPDVCLTDRGVVAFGNGRHRFTWMRMNGVRVLPIRVPIEDADEIQARYGVSPEEERQLYDLPRRTKRQHT
jgi:hypothetical protein